MPLPAALIPLAGVATKTAVPVGLGILSYGDRRRRGQTVPQALAGATAETAAGLIVPGVGSTLGKGLGLASAATKAQKIRRFVGTSAVTGGATIYAGFQSDNFTGVNASNTLAEQPANSNYPPVSTSKGYNTAQYRALPPPTSPNESPTGNLTGLVWGGLGLAGAGLAFAATRGRAGSKELASRLAATATTTPVGTDIVRGAGQITSGAGRVLSATTRSLAQNSAKLKLSDVGPVAAKTVRSTAQALDAADIKLAAGEIPVPPPGVVAKNVQTVINSTTADPRFASVIRAGAGVSLSRVSPKAGLDVLSGRYALGQVGRNTVNTGAKSATAATATTAATAATAANPNWFQRVAGPFVKNFATGSVSAEFGKQVMSAVAVSPLLRAVGIRRVLPAAGAAAVLVPTAAMVANRRTDAEFGTQTAAWDALLFGGNVNKTLGLPGTRNQERERRAGVQMRGQDNNLQIAKIRSDAQVEAARLRAASLGVFGRGMYTNGNVAPGKSYFGPALGQDFAKKSAGGPMIAPVIEQERIKQTGLVTVADGEQRTVRYKADRELDGARLRETGATNRQGIQTRGQIAVARIETGGKMKIAAGEQFTKRYEADRNLDGTKIKESGATERQRIQTGGLVTIARGDQYTSRYKADRDLQGVRTKTAGDVQRTLIETQGKTTIARGDQYTQRYQADQTLRGSIFKTQGDIERERIATAGKTQVAEIDSGVKRYQADQTLAGTRDTNLSNQTVAKINSKATVDKAQIDSFAQIAASQANAAATAHKAAIEADPEFMLAKTEAEFNAIKFRRALQNLYSVKR